MWFWSGIEGKRRKLNFFWRFIQLELSDLNYSQDSTLMF